MDKTTYLKQKIITFTSTVPHSRIHLLKTFHTPFAFSQVKRDDELGFGISGSKLRKYSSLILHLLKSGYQEAVVIGSAYSNHVLAISQLLIENCIKPTLFLLGNPSNYKKGNLLLTSLLVPESQCHWISRNEWPQVEILASDYVRRNPLPTLLIPEGAFMDAALPGALTLALDILQNEEENQHPFDHIFMDAGSGLTAIATILAFAWLNKKTMLHILLLADNEPCFLTKLKQCKNSFEILIGSELDLSSTSMNFKLYQPTLAKSFGSVNSTIINHIKFFAREEGFFIDPIYSAKLFWEAKKIIKAQALTGHILVIHSGGALTLMGFQKQLSNI